MSKPLCGSVLVCGLLLCGSQLVTLCMWDKTVVPVVRKREVPNDTAALRLHDAIAKRVVVVVVGAGRVIRMVKCHGDGIADSHKAPAAPYMLAADPADRGPSAAVSGS